MAPTTPTRAPTTKQPTPPTTPYPTAESICIDADSLNWRSYDNELKLNGNTFKMKGLSWFGYETPNGGLYGLDVHSEDWYFQWMVDRGFNAMRLPFSGQFMESSSNREKYRATVEKAGKYGIFVMPDFHSYNTGSWTDGLDTINQANTIQQWGVIAELLKDEWNVFIADIFNEPHDVDNNEWGDWIQFCEDAADEIWSKGVNWMIAVEGTNWQCNVINCAWGENLEGVRNTGITFDNEKYFKFFLICLSNPYNPPFGVSYPNHDNPFILNVFPFNFNSLSYDLQSNESASIHIDSAVGYGVVGGVGCFVVGALVGVVGAIVYMYINYAILRK